MTRVRYSPRLSWKPFVKVKWRERNAKRGRVHRSWRIYLFGLLPVWSMPRAVTDEVAQ